MSSEFWVDYRECEQLLCVGRIMGWSMRARCYNPYEALHI